MKIQKSKKNIYKVLLPIIGALLFFLGACKKPDKGGNDGNDVQPMYGVKTANYINK